MPSADLLMLLRKCQDDLKVRPKKAPWIQDENLNLDFNRDHETVRVTTQSMTLGLVQDQTLKVLKLHAIWRDLEGITMPAIEVLNRAICEKIIKILGKYDTLQASLIEVRKLVRSKIAPSTVTQAFLRHGFKPASHYLATPRILDPLHDGPLPSLKDLQEQLREANDRQRVLDRLMTASNPPTLKRREKKSGLREAAHVVLCSDWHVEENVYSERVAGRNEYNTEIARARIRKLFEGYAWHTSFARERYKVRDAVVWLGGDLLTGYIHEELEEDNSLSPIETLVFLQKEIVQQIDLMLLDSQLEKIWVPCSHGNHGRTTKKIRRKTGAKNSFEWLLYTQLQERYKKEPRIQFIVDQSAHQYLEVFGTRVHFHHGDEVKFGGGIGGLAVPLLKRVHKWDQVRKCDLHCIGHFHTHNLFGRAITNGSLIGYSEYSMAIGADYERPQQAQFLIDSQRGVREWPAIWVGDNT